MREIIAILGLAAGILALPASADVPPKGKILFIASNMEDMGDPDKHDARNNLWEYAPPYHVFVLHGYLVDFASPKGGPVPFMMEPLGISSYTIKYEGFMDKAMQSLAPDQVSPGEYAGVYIGGGYGTLFDVSVDPKMMKLIAVIYENGGVIGGSGHGPGAFANVKLSDGSFMVSGKRVAGFPNSTEVEKPWAENGKLLPFLVESRLRENGAKVMNKSNIKDEAAVISDGRIVSTMFLPSAAIVAKEIITLLEGGGLGKRLKQD